MMKGKFRTGANGYLLFYCPGCETAHACSNPPWVFNGDYDHPTLSPSILVTGKIKATEEQWTRIMAGEKLDLPEMRCHSFIKEGNIEFLSDCTHQLASKTVLLPDLPDWMKD